MKKFRSNQERRRGAALIIVLAFIVLLTGLILTYLSLSKSDSQFSNSSFTSSKADLLANSAMAVIVGDLKQEIANGSTAVTGNAGSTTNYIPLNATNMVPYVDVTAVPALSTNGIPNLIRISSHLDAATTPTSTAPMVGSRASNISTTTPAANGKMISLKRWNKHYLLPRQTSTVGSTTFDSTPTQNFVAPDWVYLTSQGPQVVTTPSTTVLGRYSYAIYDEGGILNLNAAGYPASGSTATETGGKSSIGYADLTQLTNGVSGVTYTSSQMTSLVNNLVGWRNYASSQPSGDFSSGFTYTSASATNYFNAMATNQAMGFLQTSTNSAPYNGRTDQAFLSRQQLIDYWTAQNLPPDLLQFVGTFSRDANTSPTFSPLYDATTLGGSSTYNYKSNASNTSTPPINPNFLTWRFTSSTTVTNYDVYGNSTTVQVNKGDPVVRKRFNLNRISWLTYTGPNASIANAAAAIKQCFGLTWGTGANGIACWIYTSPTGSTTSPPTSIKTLDQVAAANREPDFFELLQAGILNGSLGLDAGTMSTGVAGNGGPAGETHLYDQSTAFQVLQIGANIIDQYTSDNYPTEISAQFNVGTAPGTASALQSVYGIKNLPYLYGVYFTVMRAQSDFRNVGSWLMPEIWNPHQQPVTAPATGPTNFRFVASGLASLLVFIPGTYEGFGYATNINGPTVTLDNDTTGVTFTIGGTLTAIEPVLLDQTNASASNTNDNVTNAQMTFTTGFAAGGGVSTSSYTTNQHGYLGIFCGNVEDIDSTETTSSIPRYFDGTLTPTGVTLFLQYKDASGNWRTYSQMKSVSNTTHGGSYADLFLNTGLSYFAMRSGGDPRTDRFSCNEQYQSFGGSPSGSNGYALPNKTIWTGAAGTGEAYTRYTPTNAHFVLSGSGSAGTLPINSWCNPWQLGENRNPPTITGSSSGAEYYTDVDGVLRRADGAYSLKTGNPTYARDGIAQVTGNSYSRPIVLNRPFKNVGEIGYAFRDLPWKNVDFFTPESADSGLLDLFTVEDVGDTTMTAGHVNLNTRQAPVLASLLSGVTQIEPVTTTTSTPISTSNAIAFAKTIVSSSTATPFSNRAELVSRFSTGSSYDTDSRFASLTALPFNNSTTTSPNPNIIKAERESIVRGLSDSTTTRTWNLMIDVIAQSGHYPPGSTALSQFVVDGERRYWLHIAIDRYTGAVIDRVLEPVYE